MKYCSEQINSQGYASLTSNFRIKGHAHSTHIIIGCGSDFSCTSSPMSWKKEQKKKRKKYETETPYASSGGMVMIQLTVDCKKWVLLNCLRLLNNTVSWSAAKNTLQSEERDKLNGPFCNCGRLML